MIDPHVALASAIAHSRQAPRPAMPMHPGVIHQMASQLASQLAAARQPLGMAKIQPTQAPQFQDILTGSGPPIDPGFNISYPGVQNPNGVGYAPNGNPEDYAPAGPNGATDNAFFVHQLAHAAAQYQPGQIVHPGYSLAF